MPNFLRKSLLRGVNKSQPRPTQGRQHGFRPWWAKIFRENSAQSAEKIF